MSCNIFQNFHQIFKYLYRKLCLCVEFYQALHHCDSDQWNHRILELSRKLCDVIGHCLRSMTDDKIWRIGIIFDISITKPPGTFVDFFWDYWNCLIISFITKIRNNGLIRTIFYWLCSVWELYWMSHFQMPNYVLKILLIYIVTILT